MTLAEIINFLPLSDTLLTGGMPTAEQLAAAAKAGVQVIINLAPFDPAKDLADEAELVRSLGMEYVNIPVDWNSPAAENLEDFMNEMDAHQQEKVFVHCRANFRVSGFVALYRILRLGWKKEEAFKELRQIWNPEDFPAWDNFLKDHLRDKAE